MTKINVTMKIREEIGPVYLVFTESGHAAIRLEGRADERTLKRIREWVQGVETGHSAREAVEADA